MGIRAPRFSSEEPADPPSEPTQRRTQRPSRITRQDRYRVRRAYRGLRNTQPARRAAQIGRALDATRLITSHQLPVQQPQQNQSLVGGSHIVPALSRESITSPSNRVDANGLSTLPGLPVSHTEVAVRMRKR